jgi:beta-mannosidase
MLVSPHIENGQLAVYVVSDRTTPTAGQLRVRLMTFNGTILHDETAPVQIPALSSQICLQTALAQVVPAGSDTAKTFIVADLSVDGQTASRNLVYLRPTKQIRLPAAHIAADLRQDGDAYLVRLTSDMLSRSVWLSFGTLNVEPSDNYFDLLPGESVDIRIHGAATLDEVRKNLTIRSLVDAFEPEQSSAPTEPRAKDQP